MEGKKSEMINDAGVLRCPHCFGTATNLHIAVLNILLIAGRWLQCHFVPVVCAAITTIKYYYFRGCILSDFFYLHYHTKAEHCGIRGGGNSQSFVKKP
jgi:hypothetical protein